MGDACTCRGSLFGVAAAAAGKVGSATKAAVKTAILTLDGARYVMVKPIAAMIGVVFTERASQVDGDAALANDEG